LAGLASVPASTDADYRTPELIALAQGLQNDRDRIFVWVRDNIRYVHYHGCKKGAHLTYLERSGNDVDTCALLVALWRAAGIDCRYVYGYVEMPLYSSAGIDSPAYQVDWHHYLGVEANTDGSFGALERLIFNRGTPEGGFGTVRGPSHRVLNRFWVQANENGAWLNYDPSFKLIEEVAGVPDLMARMGYDRATLLSPSVLGTGTPNTTSITGLNSSGLSDYLKDRTTQLLANFQSDPSLFSSSTEKIVGGWVARSMHPALDRSGHPLLALAGQDQNYVVGMFFDSNNQPSVFTSLPSELYCQMKLELTQSNRQDVLVYNMARLRGERLTLQINAGFIYFYIEGRLLRTYQLVDPTLKVNVVLTHCSTNPIFGGQWIAGLNLNETFEMKCRNNSLYALIYGFDVSSEYLKTRQEALDVYRQTVADTDLDMRSEVLNVIGLNWLLQTDLSQRLICNLKRLAPGFLMRFGRVAHETTASGNRALYIDVPSNFDGSIVRGAALSPEDRRVPPTTWAFIASAMEHGVLEQMQSGVGDSATSTVKMLKLANDSSIPVHLAENAAQWNTVKSKLTGYSGPVSDATSDLGRMNWAIQQGGSVLAPQSGSIPSSSWAGRGYAYVLDSSLAMVIKGSYSGGYSGNYIPELDANTVVEQSNNLSSRFNTAPVTLWASLGGDPIDMATGDFTHSRELLTAGEGLVRGLNLSVSYHGARRMKNSAKMGYGWTHSYHTRIFKRPDIEGAYGKKSPAEMASTLVGTLIALDLFQKRGLNREGLVTDNGANRTRNWLTTALVADWLVTRLKTSGVAIVSSEKIWDFHRQPDGSYTAPPGSTLTLKKNAQERFELTERHGPTWRFDVDDRLKEIEDLWGKKLVLTYTEPGAIGKVQTVTDAFGRSLTFTYNGPNNALKSVSDNSSPARTLLFDVDASGNLLSFTDPEGKADRFSYSDPPTAHAVAFYRNHDGQVVAQNEYNDRMQVVRQYSMGDLGKRWDFFYAPGVTVEREPTGEGVAQTFHYFDDRKREVEVINALGHRFLTSYDGQNRVIARQRLITDQTGAVAVDEFEAFVYDKNHNLIFQIDPAGYLTSYIYDELNRLLSVTDKRDSVQSFQNYNAQHQPGQITDREGRVTTMTYKPLGDPAAGQIATSTEGGYTTSYHYDSRGTLTKTVYPPTPGNPNGAEVNRINNLLGDPVTLTDELSRQTTITYNKRREVLTQTTPSTTTASGPRTTTTTYDNARNVATVQNPRLKTTSHTYSATRKLLTTTLPGNAVVTNRYNARDQLDWTSDPLNQTTSFGLDALGRTVAITDPLGRTSTTIFQDDQRRTTTQSPAPLNIQSKVTVDDRGQMARTENGLGHYAVPGYDGNGNQTTFSDRRQKLWQMSYDKENRLLSTTSPLLRTTTQTYNARGLLEKIVEPSGQTTTFSYDSRRRLVRKSDSAGTIINPVANIDYTLNDAGELTAVTESSNPLIAYTLRRTYWPSGEVATYTNANNQTIRYDYDKNGNLAALTYPAIGTSAALTVAYTYDDRDRLATVSENGRTTTFFWDAASRLTQITRPNGTKRVLSYDSAGQLRRVEERPASGPAFAFRVFAYDAAGRLEKRLAYPQGVWSESAWSAGYNDDNQLTTLAGVNLSYDPDGNLLGSPLPTGPWNYAGANASYEWDPRNRLRATRISATNVTSYDYDAENHLIRWGGTQTTSWVVDPHGPGGRSRVLARVTNTGEVTRYIYAGGTLLYELRADGNVRHYHYDHLGSTIALTDNLGGVTGRADYSPYGALLGASGELANPATTPFQFIGAHGVMTDPTTGLHHMRARWYSSHLRRFLSEDPIGFAGGSNWYQYANGNPVMYVDPEGTWAWIVAGAAIGGVLDGGITLYTQYRAGNGVDWGAVGAATARGAVAGAISSIAGPAAGTAARSAGFLATGTAAKVASVGISAAGSGAGQVVNNAILGNSLSDGVGTAAAFGAGGQVLSNLIPVRGVASLAQAEHFAPQSFAAMVATPNAQRLTASYFVSNAVSAASNFLPPGSSSSSGMATGSTLSTSLPDFSGSLWSGGQNSSYGRK
jgi:RHS repeat-associated protein